ncbi:MAG: polysaccharide biosynthesis/export family protein, partial [Terriglobia bacterium]
MALVASSLCFSGLAQQPPLPPPGQELRTTEDWNKRLQELLRRSEPVPLASAQEYRIGTEDLVEITVFEAPELNRTLRVSASGEISLPLLGMVRAAGLTPRELELVLQELLRRAYMKDPHVGVFVRELQSHPVSVLGAVARPGVFQVRGSKTLLEMLSLAGGLADDAGDTVIVMRGASFGVAQPGNKHPNDGAAPGDSEEAPDAATVEINLKTLLESGDPGSNVPIYPGDIVKVPRAGVVYVVGEVKKPGGFVLKNNEQLSVLQAIALGGGLTRTAAKKHTLI